MKKHGWMAITAVIIGGLTMTAGESPDRHNHTRFPPVSDTEFVWDGTVLLGYSDEDRERWMREDVARYGMCPNGFDEIDRRVYSQSDSVLSPDRLLIRGRCKQGG